MNGSPLATTPVRLLLAGVALALPLTLGTAVYAKHGNSSAAPAAAAEEPAAEATEAEDVAAGDDAAAAGDFAYITEEQIAAGEAAYTANCATCHGQDIVASIAGYPNAGLFFSYISTAMPASAPGSLPQQTYADIIAYLLSENGFPAGGETLPPDRAVLDTIDPGEPPAGGDAAADESADDAEGSADDATEEGAAEGEETTSP